SARESLSEHEEPHDVGGRDRGPRADDERGPPQEAARPAHAEGDRAAGQHDRDERDDKDEDGRADCPGDKPGRAHAAEREGQALVLLGFREWRSKGYRRGAHAGTTGTTGTRGRTSSRFTSSRAETIPADVRRLSAPNGWRAPNGTRPGSPASVEPTWTQHCWSRSTFIVQASMKD